jgi:hypothetical protein
MSAMSPVVQIERKRRRSENESAMGASKNTLSGKIRPDISDRIPGKVKGADGSYLQLSLTRTAKISENQN